MDLRFLFLDGGFVYVVRQLPGEHRRARRSGRIGDFRWKSGDER